MLITPGEAERPGAAMRLRYLPPAVSILRVELEKSIVADGSSQVPKNIVLDSSSLTWGQEIELGEVNADGEGGDIEMSW
jgi:hypothetical protein